MGAGLKTAMSALRHRGFTIEPCPSLAESPPCRPLSDQEAMRRRRLPSMLSPSGVQVSTRKVKCVLVVLNPPSWSDISACPHGPTDFFYFAAAVPEGISSA